MTIFDFNEKIFALQNEGLEIFSIGKSVQGRQIYGTHIGSFSGPQVIIQGGIHAREYISSLLVIELAKLYAKKTYNSGGIFFIFCTNPDGVALVLDGLKSVRCEQTRQYIENTNGSTDFAEYKANSNLVDLNTNFDAEWGTGTQNVTCPSPGNFIGFYPASEKEVTVLTNFTLKNRAKFTISYHAKGEVIYYGFTGESESNLQRDKIIGQRLADSTGYNLILTENSSGGYKDWCIMKLKIPSYTIELGKATLTFPISIDALPEMLEQNKDVPQIALEEALKL